MLTAKAKEQEEKILDYEEKSQQEKSLKEENELYRQQVGSIKEELQVKTCSS